MCTNNELNVYKKKKTNISELGAEMGQYREHSSNSNVTLIRDLELTPYSLWMWIEFVVGYCSCSESYFVWILSFPPSIITINLKF